MDYVWVTILGAACFGGVVWTGWSVIDLIRYATMSDEKLSQKVFPKPRISELAQSDPKKCRRLLIGFDLLFLAVSVALAAGSGIAVVNICNRMYRTVKIRSDSWVIAVGYLVAGAIVWRGIAAFSTLYEMEDMPLPSLTRAVLFVGPVGNNNELRRIGTPFQVPVVFPPELERIQLAVPRRNICHTRETFASELVPDLPNAIQSNIVRCIADPHRLPITSNVVEHSVLIVHKMVDCPYERIG
jgi:hypothetical protein